MDCNIQYGNILQGEYLMEKQHQTLVYCVSVLRGLHYLTPWGYALRFSIFFSCVELLMKHFGLCIKVSTSNIITQQNFVVAVKVACCSKLNWHLLVSTNFFNLEQQHFVAWQCLRWVVIRATTLFNLQCNNVACKVKKNVAHAYYRAFTLKNHKSQFRYSICNTVF